MLTNTFRLISIKQPRDKQTETKGTVILPTVLYRSKSWSLTHIRGRKHTDSVSEQDAEEYIWA
jgi:hypothetical protein